MASSPTSSEVPKESGAAARLSQQEEEELRHEAEVSSGNNGGGERTVTGEEEDTPAQGGAESTKAPLQKKREGLPKGRWLPPQIWQDHNDQLIEDGKLRADCGYRLPLASDVPPKPEAGELVVFKAQIGRAHV